MQFFDTVLMDGAPRVTRAGYLVADVRIARTGIQTYTGREVGRPGMPIVRVHRPDSEVFADRSMGSFAHRPVTIEHPGVMVDATNWKQFGVGSTGDSVARDGQYLRVPMTMMDAGAIQTWQDGKRELSAGYTCDLDWTPGVTTDGEPYDAIQRNIIANHLAVVDTARAGPACRVGDTEPAPEPTPAKQQTGNPTMADSPLKTVVVDGVSIDTNDAGQAALLRLMDGMAARHTTALAAKDAALANAGIAHAAAIAARDAEAGTAAVAATQGLAAKDAALGAAAAEHATAIAARDGEIAALKLKVPDATALDSMIAERLDVQTAARSVLGDSFDMRGKGSAEIKSATLVKLMGDAAIAGKPEAYIDAAFDVATKVKAGDAAAHDPLRAAIAASGGMADSARPSANPATVQAGLDGMYAWLGDAYKTT